MLTHIFLDMDGVLADFVSGICRVHGRPSPYGKGLQSTGKFDMAALWGMSAAEFWAPSDGPDFWSTLEVMPQAEELMDLVFQYAPVDRVGILSSPSESQHCVSGKREWLRKHFGPRLSKNALFGSRKDFLARNGVVLIDDYDKNIDNFINAGGWGVVYPQWWNRLHSLQENRLEHVDGVLEMISRLA